MVAEAIDADQALELVRRELGALEAAEGLDLVLLTDSTIETDVGWVFFWDSRQHAESGAASDAMAGNGPFLVDRTDSSVHRLGTAEPADAYLNRYRQTGSAFEDGS